MFQGSPESFDKDVVLEAALAIHADFDVPGLEDRCKCFAGKLATLVSVEDSWRPVFEQGFFQCLDTEPCIKSIGQSPRQDFPGGPVHNSDQVHESLLHGDVSDVSGPDLVWTVNGQAPQQIGVNRMSWLPLASAGFWGQRYDPHGQHQTSDPITAYGLL